MKILTIDIETGGLEPHKHSLLEIGMVYHCLQKATVESARVVFLHENLCITPFCINMHGKLLAEIHDVEQSDWWNNLVDNGYTFAHVAPGEDESLSTYHTTYCMGGEYMRQGFHGALGELHVDVERGARTVVAGKNLAGFDLPFMAENGLLDIAENGDQFRAHRRVLDPCTGITSPNDIVPPDLAECLQRAGLCAIVGHQAMSDAHAVDALVSQQILKNTPVTA